MLRPMALDHVGLLVSDMDEALKFYRTLGLEVLRISDPKADGERSAVIRVGGQELNVFSSPAHLPVDRNTLSGIHHFCLNMQAASIEELIADLGEAGLTITGGPTKRRDGTAVFVNDPDGIKVELRLPFSPA
jgi:catechol 2,3-dioxygenase-like lactoylglutathione lyase family enzyme